MASTFNSSLYKASDLIHDFTCSPCEEDGLNSEAQYFCVDCSRYYCSRCESKHGGLFKRHKVLDRKDVKKWVAVPETVVDELERCERHPGKAVELFCGDHQQLCCNICVSVDHRQCSLIQHIPDVAKGIRNKPEFKQLPRQVAKIQAQIRKLQDSRKTNQQSIRASRSMILQEIKAFRKKMNKVFDHLEQHTIDEMDSMVETFEEKIKEDVEQCERMSKEMESFIDTTQTKGKFDESLAFLGYSRCQKIIKETNIFIQYTTATEELTLSLAPNIALHDLIASFESLDKIGDITYLGHALKVEIIKKYNVAIVEDKNECEISSLCELPTGEVVLVDEKNSRVKLLTHEYQPVDHCNVSHYPQEVCHIARNEVAVTINLNYDNRHKVQMFNVMYSKLQQTRCLKLEHTIRGIAHHLGRLYITSDTALHSYDMIGNDRRKLFEDKSDTHTVFKCAISSDGSTIYVTNYSKSKLLTLDIAGNKLATLIDADIKKPYGVHSSSAGHVFVCCSGSKTVLQLDKEGKTKMTVMASSTEGVNCALSVCYLNRSSTLVLGDISDNILVLKLKKNWQ
ncbi:uncharacterized protein LOC128216953 [Mya arenaria]|uniref:uncharacterized protein LOC128216953 n=1 Tax=Mya arenaria TaxID=6604 RepID=UPI0022E2F829|nr:uncharacterized protein LOC128216953 [Mya arenaria]